MSKGTITGYADYHAGDVVTLRSGGPKMTVWAMGDRGQVDTEWFAGDDLRRDRFHTDELVADLDDNPRILADIEGARLQSVWGAAASLKEDRIVPFDYQWTTAS